MTATERLQRLITDELGECCESDLERRLDELEALAGRAFGPSPDADARALSVLGDETRYRITRLLAAAEDELCVCEVDPLVDVSESAVSHALSDLADAGLATRRKDGKWRYYDSTERAEALVAALDANRGEPA